MATNYARASYTEIYDIQTSPNAPTVLGVHTPEIELPFKMLGGFFRQFAKFRYAGCDISFVPVATLPLDPLQVGTEAGKTAPQDVVNPIIHKAFMGESLGSFFDTYFPQFTDVIFGNPDLPIPSVDVSSENTTAMATAFESVYYQALSDQRFFKSGVQVGFKRDGLVPLVRRVNSNMQFGPYANRDVLDASRLPSDVTEVDVTNIGNIALNNQELDRSKSMDFYSTPPALFSSGAYPLDWLDTLTKVGLGGSDNVPALSQGYAWLPKLYMYFIMLPPSINTVMYFRMVIRHRFEFKEFQCMHPFGINTEVFDTRFEISPAYRGGTVEPT